VYFKDSTPRNGITVCFLQICPFCSVPAVWANHKRTKAEASFAEWPIAPPVDARIMYPICWSNVARSVPAIFFSRCVRVALYIGKKEGLRDFVRH